MDDPPVRTLPYDDPTYVERLTPCTELLWDVAFEVLGAGSSVILDWNFWSRQRRADALHRARGHSVSLHWLDVPLEEVVRRAKDRVAQSPSDAHPVNEDGVRHFATIFEPPDQDEGLLIIAHS